MILETLLVSLRWLRGFSKIIGVFKWESRVFQVLLPKRRIIISKKESPGTEIREQA